MRGVSQPRCLVSSEAPQRSAGLLDAGHDEDDVAALAGEADAGGVALLSLGAFAVVEGLGSRVAEGGRGGEEPGVPQPVLATSALGPRTQRVARCGVNAG